MRRHKWALNQTSAQEPASQILPAETKTSDATWGFFVEFEVDDDCSSSLDYEGITQSSDFGFKSEAFDDAIDFSYLLIIILIL
jgi:hypothetical protein